MAEKTNHFVLVHGLCHGAWCWYKLVPLLKSQGHRVTALDMSGCGVDPKRFDQITSISEYVQPLMEFMESLRQDEKVVLVGHSHGGIVISLAMEIFPEKILVAIYVSALVPNSESTLANVVQEYFKRTSTEALMDSQVFLNNEPKNPSTPVTLGSQHMAAKLYQYCQTEDLELAKMLVRPGGLFLGDLAKESLLTEENFWSVKRAYVVCEKDAAVEEDFQRWLIEKSQTKEVEVVLGADHMVMLSKPHQLSLCLVKIADKHC